MEDVELIIRDAKTFLGDYTCQSKLYIAFCFITEQERQYFDVTMKVTKR
ncbi:hypothetical protein [Halalkalibacterium halodurans]|nr:hypothetical protein [Halalkalibacterium halodurans]